MDVLTGGVGELTQFLLSSLSLRIPWGGREGAALPEGKVSWTFSAEVSAHEHFDRNLGYRHPNNGQLQQVPGSSIDHPAGTRSSH